MTTASTPGSPFASAFATAAALLLAAAFTASPAWADKDKDKHHGKHAEKHAQKHADKEWKHADKHAEKAQKRADKAERKADKHAAKARHHDDVRVGAFFNDDNRQVARSYYVQQYGSGKACPPGLARKDNGCLPPGQAKKYAVGQPLPRGVSYYPVPQAVVTRLPAVPVGYRYVRVGNDILLLSPQSGLVVDLIAGLLG